jgi:hypothetical protein
VHRASPAYQRESSDGAAGMQGMESAALGAETAALGAETAEESAETAGIAVAGTDTAGLLLLLAITSCRASWTERGSQQ